jgi:hypothetical protein
VYDYTRLFNTLAQYGTYHVDTDEKKANLYREGLNIHLQEHLVQFSSLLYKELASAAIDQESMMKAIAEADEKKRKRMTPGPSGRDGSSGVPPKYRMVYTPPGGPLCRPQQQQFQPQQQQQQYNYVPSPQMQQVAARPPQ